MCRYGYSRYKQHYACFSCRKVFRHQRRDADAPPICPDCTGPMADMGMDLRAPKRSDVKQWKILEGMFQAGHVFQTCGCSGPGFVPANTVEYRAYLVEREHGYRERLEAVEADTDLSPSERQERATYWAERLAKVEQVLATVRA